jgi:hypothetical protein
LTTRQKADTPFTKLEGIRQDLHEDLRENDRNGNCEANRRISCDITKEQDSGSVEGTTPSEKKKRRREQKRGR